MFTYPSQSMPAREARCRRALAKQGYRLHRSRWRLGSIDNFGGYQIIGDDRNAIVAGERFDLELEDVELWLGSVQGQEMPVDD